MGEVVPLGQVAVAACAVEGYEDDAYPLLGEWWRRGTINATVGGISEHKRGIRRSGLLR